MFSQFTSVILVNRQLAIRPEFDSRHHSFMTSCVVTPTTFETVKRPWREADHYRPFSGKVKNAWSHTSTPVMRFHVTVRRKSFTAKIKPISVQTQLNSIFYTELHVSTYFKSS